MVQPTAPPDGMCQMLAALLCYRATLAGLQLVCTYNVGLHVYTYRLYVCTYRWVQGNLPLVPEGRYSSQPGRYECMLVSEEAMVHSLCPPSACASCWIGSKDSG